MNNNKLDKIINILIDEIDKERLWHLVFNKMTNSAKRQMIQELLNHLYGTSYTTNPMLEGEEQ